MRPTLRSRWFAGLFCAAGPLLAQDEPGEVRFAVLTVDGVFRVGEPVAVERDKAALRWRDNGAKDAVAIALSDIVALHGPAPRTQGAAAVVRLVGGDELRGDLVGGDAGGETLQIRSAALGMRSVRIDRLASIVFPARAGSDAADRLIVPDDAKEDEALFVPARRGFDLVLGQVHRFREDAILFQARKEDAPRARSFATLAGFALRGGDGRAQDATTTLLSHAGDRVGVDWVGIDGDAFLFTAEDGIELRVPRGQVAGLFNDVARVVSIADQVPTAVEERSYLGDGAAPLFHVRVDRCVEGGPLRAGGFGFVRGLGVHSRSVLTFAVPVDATAVIGLVGIDDSAFELPVRGGVDIRVLVDGAVRFERRLRTGDAPVSLGRLAVRGGGTLRLEVDFGPGLDLGDRVDWLDLAYVQ